MMEIEVTEPQASDDSRFNTLRHSTQEKSPKKYEAAKVAEEDLRQKLESTPSFDEKSFHDVIVSLLSMKNTLSDARFVRFLFITAPTKSVSEKTLDHIFAHILSTPKITKFFPKIRGCLHYLVGLLKYEIIDSYDLRGQYPFYYNLLDYPNLETSVAELIYHTTTYDNINPWLVDKVQRLYRKKESLPLRALLQLFGRLRLNIVSLLDLPKVKDEINSFGAMNHVLTKTLERIASPETLAKLKKHPTMTFPDYAQLQIALRSKTYPRSVRYYAEYDDLAELLEEYLRSSYDMFQSSYDALLSNRYNFVLLGVLGHLLNDQARFYVRHIWKSIKEGDLNEKEIKLFLTNLYQLYLVFDHDVFGLREDLYNFMENNDFFTYIKEILKLVPLVSYPEYDIFFKYCLEVLYKNFIIGAQHKQSVFMSSIIKALSHLLYNTYKVKSDNYRVPFLFVNAEEREVMSDMDLSIAITASQHICKILVNVAHGDFRAMLSVMQFYEALSDGEELHKINVLNIVPTEIFYAFVINPNSLLLDRYAMLIISLLMLADMYDVPPKDSGIIEVNSQANELYAFLFRDPFASKFIQKRKIIRNSKMFKNIFDMQNLQRVYVLKNNLAFKHFSSKLPAKTSGDDWTSYKRKFPNLMTLLSHILAPGKKKK
ncbi:uncharacterized protein LOC134835067 [Culicoides brevitarsis]|uniref:uncharacterized protein LOC134835067 n=1 Tax=Culicoides brevitarsis TaxID=469753 RepID=UPI00307C0F04